MRNAVRSVLSAALLGAAALVAGCATKPVTTLEMSWVSPQLPQAPFKKLLIITVAGEEMVQIAFQDQMAAALKARGVNAVASKRYFSRYTEAEKARFRQSIEGSDADFVLIARVVNTDLSSREDQRMTFGDATGLYTAYERYASVAISSGDYSVKTVTTEASIFAVHKAKLIWSAKVGRLTPTRPPPENFAPQYIAAILEAMKKDKVPDAPPTSSLSGAVGVQRERDGRGAGSRAGERPSVWGRSMSGS
jgi:hypothetical protein